MKTIYILISILSLFNPLIWAQVGVNINDFAPNTAFHIDSKGNTSNSGSVNNVDDLFISTSGAIGVGSINPLAKLDITGNIKITDGSAGEKRVFTAVDESGLGTWQLLSLVKRFAIWRVHKYGTTINAGTTFMINGTAVFSANSLNATSNGTNSITLPVGNYLFFMRGDINLREYGQMRVYIDDTLSFFKWYNEYCTGGTFYREFTSPPTITIGFLGADVTCANCDKIPFMSNYPYTNANIWSELVILQL